MSHLNCVVQAFSGSDSNHVIYSGNANYPIALMAGFKYFLELHQ